MRQSNKSEFLTYCLTISLAMICSIIPWPDTLSILAPDWVMLTLLCWALDMPETASVGKAWCVGLLMDVLTGRLLGEYALSYSVSVFLCIKQHKRLRQFPMLQQSLAIFAILLLARILNFWIENINRQLMPFSFWLPVFTGALAWPAVCVVLRKIRVL